VAVIAPLPSGTSNFQRTRLIATHYYRDFVRGGNG
jgi:hypothetical protein